MMWDGGCASGETMYAPRPSLPVKGPLKGSGFVEVSLSLPLVLGGDGGLEDISIVTKDTISLEIEGEMGGILDVHALC